MTNSRTIHQENTAHQINKIRYKTELLYPAMTKVCSHIESNNINKISILNERYKTLIDIQALMITVIGYGRRI